MKKALNKDIRKEYTKTISRFLSILAMIALGSFIFVGLFDTGPTMRNTLLDYTSKYHLQDMTVTSPFGLDAEDQAILEAMEGISLLDYAYRTDLMVEGTDLVVRGESTAKLPSYEILQGRLPVQADEIALDGLMLEKGYTLGDQISFVPEKIGDNYPLIRYEFRITGFVNSPEYLMPTQKGSSNLGDGTVYSFAVIPAQNFNLEQVSLARITYDDLAGLDSSTEEYKSRLKAHGMLLDAAFAHRPQIRKQGFLEEGFTEITDAEQEITDAEQELSDAARKLADARVELDDGWREYADGKAEFELEIKDAEQELAEGQQELLDAKKKLDDGYAKLADGERELEDGKKELADGQAELADAFEELTDGDRQIKAAQKKIDNARNYMFDQTVALNNGLSQVEAGLVQASAGAVKLAQGIAEIDKVLPDRDANIAQIEAGLKLYQDQLFAANASAAALTEDTTDPAIAATIEYLNGQIQNLQTSKSALESLPEQKKQLEASKEDLKLTIAALEAKKQEIYAGYSKLRMGEDELDQGQQELNQKKKELQDGWDDYYEGLAKLEDAKVEIADGEAELADARVELADGQKKYDDGLLELQDGRDTLARERAKGEKELKDAYTDLLEGEQEYRDGLAEYRAELPGAREDIQEGKEEIQQARNDLARLRVPDYTIQDRHEEMGFFQYLENARSMDLLSLVFPVFFFLIALLVSLTTMTRMVDEQRLLIGTYKALGYSDWDVIKKYLSYGALASLLGSIMGIAVGRYVLMPIIFEAYSANFLFTKMMPVYSPVFALMALLISQLCTGFAALVTTRVSLREHAAELMRPKAPTIGNRILLERISPIWRRLSFHNKVTARNLFRYKKRMFMTILGVAGCAAMIFMGFGLRDSGGSMLVKQYGQLFTYDSIVIFDDQGAADEIQAYLDQLSKDERIQKAFPVRFERGVVGVPGLLDQDVTIVVPEDQKEFRQVNVLRLRQGAEEISLGEGAVISEKLAWLLGLEAGDFMEFQDSDGSVRKLLIAAVTENYTGHYLYMAPAYYQKVFEKPYQINSHFLLLNDSGTQAVSEFNRSMLAKDLVLNTVSTSVSSDTVQKLVESMNIVVIVILLASSLLAIVVLYNLTNINVSERLRELSTIMVLGFYPKEVTAYVYRETMTLTALGILVGYFLGYLLHQFIVIALPPSFVLMDPSLQATTYLYSAVFTLVFSSIVMLIMHNRLKRIDMVQALKAVE